MSRYSQGICGDGAAILRDGQMMTVDEIVAALNQAELAKPAAVPDGWVMVPRESTPEMYQAQPGYFANFTEYEESWLSSIAATPHPPAPAVLPVDVEAVREVIAYLRDFADHDSADQLARAIGDEK